MEISLTKCYLSQGDKRRPWDHLGEKTRKKRDYKVRMCKEESRGGQHGEDIGTEMRSKR